MKEKLLVCTDAHGLKRPNGFYNLTAGKIYRVHEADETEIEGDKFIWVENDLRGYVRVNLKRLVDAGEV